MKETDYGPLDLERASNNNMGSLCHQLNWLFYRAKLFVLREPQAVFAKIGQSCFSGILVLILYWHIGGKYDIKGL